MSVSWLESPQGLPAAARAALDAPTVALFDSLGWSIDFSATVDRAGVTPVWLHVADGRSSLTLPLWRTRQAVGPLRMASIEALSNYYTLRWQPLALLDGSPVPPERVGASLWRAAAGALARRGARAAFSPLDPHAAWLSHAEQALKQEGCALRRTESFGNWVADVGGLRFDDWFARRPAALRNTWRRRRRQLERRATVAFELHGAPLQPGEAGSGSACERLDEAIAAYEAVYRRSWKQPESHARFVPTMIRRAAGRGALRLGLLRADGEPVAAQLWLRDGDSTVIYKLAYDERWKDCSPGLALSVEMFRHAIDVDRVALIDYGSGDDAYKRDWMDRRRVRVALTAYRLRHPLGALMAARARWLDAGR